MSVCVLTVFLLIYASSIEAQQTYTQQVQSLTNQILKGYSRFTRPRRNQSDPVDVGVFLIINHLDNVV